MTEKDYIEDWDRRYENHKAMNFLGGSCLLGGLVIVIYVGTGAAQFNFTKLAGGFVLLYAGGVGIPRTRRWATFDRLSNVSFWDRIIGRSLFGLLALIGIALVG